MSGIEKFGVLQAIAIGLVYSTTAFADPKPLTALTEMDRLTIGYQFAPGVQWCVERLTFAWASIGNIATIDIDVASGLITLEVASEGQKVICEPQGVRFFKAGTEKEFKRFPGAM